MKKQKGFLAIPFAIALVIVLMAANEGGKAAATKTAEATPAQVAAK